VPRRPSLHVTCATASLSVFKTIYLSRHVLDKPQATGLNAPKII